MEYKGFIFIIIVFVLCFCLFVVGIVYDIIKDNNTCYDVFIESIDNEDLYYHCSHYKEHKDSFELYMHDNSKIYILKSSINNIYFMEVFDNEN